MEILFVNVAERVDFNVRIRLIRIQMIVRNAAAADDRNSDFLAHLSYLFIQPMMFFR